MYISKQNNKYLRSDECELMALIKAADRTGDEYLRQQLERVIQQIHQDERSFRAVDAEKSHDLARFFTDL